jgi:hypothetical protein
MRSHADGVVVLLRAEPADARRLFQDFHEAGDARILLSEDASMRRRCWREKDRAGMGNAGEFTAGPWMTARKSGPLAAG